MSQVRYHCHKKRFARDRNYCCSHCRVRRCIALPGSEEQGIEPQIAEQKREAYASFLNNFTKVSVAAIYDEDEKLSGKETDLERMLARDQLLLYASDEVIKAYDAWIRFSDADDKHDYDKEGELVSLIFLAIRKDLLGRTRVTSAHLANLNPFNRG